MKISAKAEYACLAILALARPRPDDPPLRIREISEAHGIPERYLVQILLQLKGAGLVHSTRGASGGYRLARPPSRSRWARSSRRSTGPADPSESPKDRPPAPWPPSGSTSATPSRASSSRPRSPSSPRAPRPGVGHLIGLWERIEPPRRQERQEIRSRDFTAENAENAERRGRRMVNSRGEKWRFPRPLDLSRLFFSQAF